MNLAGRSDDHLNETLRVDNPSTNRSQINATCYHNLNKMHQHHFGETKRQNQISNFCCMYRSRNDKR